MSEPNPISTPSHDQIAVRAYLVFLNRMENGLPGTAESDWIEAETELRAVKPSARKRPSRASRGSKATVPKKMDAQTHSSEDDLTKISGIGKVFAKRLHALGVTAYSQIAAWKSKDIEAMEESLKAPGRIGREDWVRQAKDILRE